MSTAGLKEMLGERQRTRMVQFLMKLRPEFKSIRGIVLREETRLGTQAAMESMPLPTVALLEQKSTIGTSSGNTKRSVQCYECNDFGHIAANCPKKKKFYAYCKITGHHISDCHRRPNCSRLADQAYETDVTKSAGSFRSGHDLERLIRDSIAAALPGAISSALSTSSGTSNSIKYTWHLDSGASNHTTGDLSQFSSLYDDVSKHVIHTANGHTLPASGQLVDQNCVVKFSPNDCVVQNLKTGMTMAKRRRVGKMFLLESDGSSSFLSTSAHAQIMYSSNTWHSFKSPFDMF
ncbi:hypothetical protein KY284_036352 [Solanum tuberosum]|nr:hypothetical protein KY284_036352 [Solanum tuberosum]